MYIDGDSINLLKCFYVEDTEYTFVTHKITVERGEVYVTEYLPTYKLSRSPYNSAKTYLKYFKKKYKKKVKFKEYKMEYNSEEND